MNKNRNKKKTIKIKPEKKDVQVLSLCKRLFFACIKCTSLSATIISILYGSMVNANNVHKEHR
jgi:hypothetical protein